VLSRGGQICKSTPGGGARSQFRELPLIYFETSYYGHPSRLPQSILNIFVTNDLRKSVSFQKKMLFKMCMMKGFHPYHLVSGIIRDSLV
jgi:hypothetical protein